MPASTSTPARIDYLDAVRAFALILGIVFHASLSFMPMFIGWAVMDVSTSDAIPGFVLVSHSFRMELFFLIAGFFSHMTFHKKGTTTFLKSRVLRIAIPFAIGWFILYPLIVSGWIMGGASMRGEVDILDGLAQGFATLGNPPLGYLVGGHLWFLYYLMLATAATLAIRALLSLAPQLSAQLGRATDGVLAWLASNSSHAALLAVPTAACLWFMSLWGMDTPDKSLVPHLPTFFVYTGCFLFGWLLHRQSALLIELSRFTPTRLLTLASSVALTLYLSRYQANPRFEYIEQARLAFCYSYGVMMWSLVFATIGVFRLIIRKQNKAIRYVADCSYWMYLIHLPVVVWLQIMFAELPWNWSFKLAAISLITIAISLITYDLFVRSTLIGRLLNGQKKPRLLTINHSKRNTAFVPSET